jgi:hypothetical protein
MTRASDAIVVAISLAATFVVAALTQSPETFTATATVRQGTTSTSAAVSVRIDRYATADERAALLTTARAGSSAVQKALSGHADAGYIQVGERRTPIKYAWKHSGTGGQLVTVATAEPIGFLGANRPNAAPTTGFDVAMALLDLNSGTGELAPAAKVGLDDSGAVRVEDYGATVVWLNKIVRAK